MRAKLAGHRIAHASSISSPRLRAGGSFLEETLALFVWFLDVFENPRCKDYANWDLRWFEGTRRSCTIRKARVVRVVKKALCEVEDQPM